jgi:hypothetical protein
VTSLERCLACEADSVGTLERSCCGLRTVTPSRYLYRLCSRNMRQRAAPGNDQRDSVYSGSAHKIDTLSRTWIATKRWVIRGSRLLSHFPILIRDATKSRCDEACVEAAPLHGPDRIGLASEAALHSVISYHPSARCAEIKPDEWQPCRGCRGLGN